ncbi:hypothetical protein K501DRAFT_275401 [Backusella circina FSU 941]|nr:hypothetical protein K501DRAFT_275401 [Backusella circina FSU 941]
MSNSNSKALTKEQLFAYLECDRIIADEDLLSRVKDNDGEALKTIGLTYYTQTKDHSKAMAWFRLAANQNRIYACHIGRMYANGLGVSQDHDIAMEYYLKAAGSNNKVAMDNIGICFLKGHGVPLDKYKTLEWFMKSRNGPEIVEKLNKKGIHLTEEDKKMKNLRRDNQRLQNESKQNTDLFEEEIQKENVDKGSLPEAIHYLQQQLKDKEEIINSLKRENEVYQLFVQSKNNEIDLLKKDNQRLGNLEQENKVEIGELKRKLGEIHQESMSATDSTYGCTFTNNNGDNDCNYNTTNGIITHSTELNNQGLYSNGFGNNLNNVKINNITHLGLKFLVWSDHRN